jgi:thioredoxin-related protein
MYKNLVKIALATCLFCSCHNENGVVQKVSNQDLKTQTLELPVKAKDHAHLNTSGLLWKELSDFINERPSGSKMILLDIYTQWCGYCKLMDKKTFSDQATQKLLSDNFELIKFDAESRDSIDFKGKRYGWRSDGKKGIHELAAELMDGKLSYPTLIFMDKDLKTIRVSRGYKNPSALTQEAEMALRI